MESSDQLYLMDILHILSIYSLRSRILICLIIALGSYIFFPMDADKLNYLKGSKWYALRSLYNLPLAPVPHLNIFQREKNHST